MNTNNSISVVRNRRNSRETGISATKCTNSLNNHKSLNNVIKLIIIDCLICILCVSRVSSELKPIRNLETIEFNSGPVFKVVVIPDSNDIIVGGRNSIYKISSVEFKQIRNHTTGPVEDSDQCLPPPEPCAADKRLVNNDNQILVITKHRTNQEDYTLLLACGDAYQGMCYLLKAENFSFVRIYGQPNDSLNFVGSRASSFAFFAPYSTPGKNALYVAHAYDGRPLEYSPPTISSRKLNGFNGFSLAHARDAHFTQVDFHPTYKQTYNVKYIYGFNHSHYSYFVSTQPLTVRSQNYETKLIRICQMDNEFFSYMEIPLICSSGDQRSSRSNANNKNVDHLIASTAYFGRVGSHKYRDLGINRDTDSYALYVSLGVPTVGTTFNKTYGSAICAFTIRNINQAFTNAAKECFRASASSSGVHRLEVIEGKREECRSNELVDVSDDFCGSGFNPHIGSNNPLIGVFLTQIKSKVTSLAVAVQNKSTVAAIGTEEGLLMKVLLDERSASEKPLFDMNISAPGSTDREVRPNPAFDSQEKNLYVLTGSSLFQVPFGSCSLHTDCATCLDTPDPLNCGWCGSPSTGGYCATDQECQHPTLMSKKMCPPEVFDFSPKSGPLLGGTIVTISGDNLGYPHSSSENSNIKITIADTDCEVVDWQPKRVQCKTSAVNKEVSGLVRVSVQDVTGVNHGTNYDINGTAVSNEEYKYLEPELRGVYPSFGPMAGGTSVIVIGANLHIGSNRTIYLSGIECKEIDNNSTFLSCISGPQTSPSTDTSVKLFIDSNEMIVNQNRTISSKDVSDSGRTPKDELYSHQWSEYFEYKPNPKIYSYEPKTTISSGNTNITVNGINLNSVNNPRILVTIYSRVTYEKIRSEGQCRVNGLGTQMVCQTPAIRDPIEPPKSKIPIDSQLSFILDGVKNYGLNTQTTRLAYRPDPIYHNFTEQARAVYLEEPVLKIDGKDLSSDYPIDIRIGKYEIPCNVSNAINFEAIYCKIQYNDLLFKDKGSQHKVVIRVGNQIFSPGYIKFVSKPSDISVGTIMVSTLVPIILIAVIIVGILYYLKYQGVILKKYPPPTVHYNRDDSETGDRPSYMSQHSHNNYVRGDVTHPLLSVGEASGGRRYQASEETMNLLREEQILIDRSNISLEQVIGQGQFGCVYKGLLYSPEKDLGREVAVKTLHSSVMRDEMDIDSFIKEGLIMKDFKDHHVLTMIGVCFEDDGSPVVVLPFMENGDLLSYIRDEKNNPTVKNLLVFAIEIARGMDYLATQKFVHRDLAARNCMLDSELCVKVADFGLSRDIYEREYYSSDNKKCKLPVKWMAPESLEKGTYNTKTDVWSYGVVVWELLTRGVTPYPDVDNWEILNYLKQGRRMPRPAFCPELLYFILLRCWSDDSKERPTFSELVDEVQSVITKLEKGTEKQRVDLDKCNTYVNYPVPNTYYNDSQPQALTQSEPPLVGKSFDFDMNDNQPKASVYETTC